MWTQTLTPFGIQHWDSSKAFKVLRERAAKSVSPDIGIGPSKHPVGHTVMVHIVRHTVLHTVAMLHTVVHTIV